MIDREEIGRSYGDLNLVVTIVRWVTQRRLGYAGKTLVPMLFYSNPWLRPVNLRKPSLMLRIQQHFWSLCARRLGLRLYYVYRAPLNRQKRLPPPGVEARCNDLVSLQHCFGDPQWDLTAEFAAAALARENLCVCTYKEGEMAAYGWVSYAAAPHNDGLWVRFGPRQRYNYKNWTHPDYRGQRLRGSFGALARADAEHEVTHSIAIIHPHFVASIRAEERNGGSRVGWAGYWRFGLSSNKPRVIRFRNAGARAAGLEFVSEAEL